MSRREGNRPAGRRAVAQSTRMFPQPLTHSQSPASMQLKANAHEVWMPSRKQVHPSGWAQLRVRAAAIRLSFCSEEASVARDLFLLLLG